MERSHVLAKSAYRQSVEDVAESLGARVRDGLSDDDVRAKLERDGPNELEAEKPVPAWRRFLAGFQDVLVILLLVATTVSAVLWIYERETALPYEALAILAVVLLNATMGYLQESRAEAAVAALRAMSAADATVIRDGERRRVAAS
jgi:P-type Ca2+ transporter type 2C